MSRAALLPYPGDPFLLNYWLYFFDTVWGGDVDKLYIHLNSSIEPEVVQYIREICSERPQITLYYTDHQTDHGPSIDYMLERCQEEYVMLVEDDGFIFRPGLVERCFRWLENGQYDIVGSKRGSCSMEILTAVQNKWGLQYEGEGDQGPNFWPNYLFLKAELLRATDRNFSAKQWQQGETIAGLDHVVTSEFVNGDTLVNTSLQLRGMVPTDRIMIVPQYHGHPSDLEHYQAGKYLFDGAASWTHVGSLSSGVGGILMDHDGRQLSRRKIDPPKGPTKLPNGPTTLQEREEYERRVQWWRKFARFYLKETAYRPEYMDDFYVAYVDAIVQIIDQFELRERELDKRDKVYATLGL